MSERYLIVSSDCHAGLRARSTGRYLDEQVPGCLRRVPRRAARQPRRGAEVQLRLHHALGGRQRGRPPRCLRSRAARQGARRRRRRRRGDVRRRDAITGMESPPFGAGLSAGTSRIPSSRTRARSRTTAGWPSSARTRPTPRRHRARADHPRRRRGVAEIAARGDARHPRDHDPDHVARPQGVQRPGVRAGLGRGCRARSRRARALRRGAARGLRRRHRAVPRRGRWWSARRSRSCSSAGCSSVTPSSSSASPRALRTGPPT